MEDDHGPGPRSRRWKKSREPEERKPGTPGPEPMHRPGCVWVADVSVHDLRPSLGSWQAVTGSSPSLFGGTLGHHGPAATAVNARIHTDPVCDAIAAAVDAKLKHGGVEAAEVVDIGSRPDSTDAEDWCLRTSSSLVQTSCYVERNLA